MEILVGCDPEVFVMKDGRYLSAHGLVQGSKYAPFLVPKGAVQVDGMALEFNIDPAKSEEEFCINVETVFQTLKSMVPEYQVVATPVADFSEEYLKAQPKEALELGCDPDFNAWTMKENIKPVAREPMRTASGHVHIGWGKDMNPSDPEHQGRCAMVARQLDFFLGLPSLFYDNDVRRRSLYGAPGACRYKPYGVEYRVLSNAWLNSRSLMAWVYRNTVQGVTRLLNGEDMAEKYGDIQKIIINSDKESAIGIIKQEGIEVPNYV